MLAASVASKGPSEETSAGADDGFAEPEAEPSGRLRSGAESGPRRQSTCDARRRRPRDLIRATAPVPSNRSVEGSGTGAGAAYWR